jgi:hypothetical protein
MPHTYNRNQDEAAGEIPANAGRARLACQIMMAPHLDGLHVCVPSSSHNMLEVPLWMRRRWLDACHFIGSTKLFFTLKWTFSAVCKLHRMPLQERIPNKIVMRAALQKNGARAGLHVSKARIHGTL